MPPEGIETSKSLLDYSLSSVTAMMLVGDLEEWLTLTLPPTLVWDYPSIAAIADYLIEQVGSAAADAPAGTEAVNGRRRTSSRTADPPRRGVVPFPRSAIRPGGGRAAQPDDGRAERRRVVLRGRRPLRASGRVRPRIPTIPGDIDERPRGIPPDALP